MKKILFATLGVTLLTTLSFAQSNNPYNQRGIDYVSSMRIITADYDAGRVTEFNEETLNRYSSTIPLQNQVSVDMAGSIVRTLSSPSFNFNTTIDNTSLSSSTKDAVKELYTKATTSTVDDLQRYLVTKSDEMNRSSSNPAEKELVLSLIAITYNVSVEAVSSNSANRRNSICNAIAVEPITPGECAVVGAITGGAIGFVICGPLCGLGGAIIGGLVGGLS
jgi:hypothetical protein